MIVPTSGAAVEDFIEWMREELRAMDYGEVGLVFTVHDRRVTGIEKTSKIKARLR